MYWVCLGMGLAAVVGAALWYRYYKLILSPLYRLEERLTRLAGQDAKFERRFFTGNPIQDAEKSVTYIENLIEDLGSRAREEHFNVEAISASMVEGVLVLDDSRKVEMANEAFCKMFNLTSAPEGKLLMDVVRNSEVQGCMNKTFENKAKCYCSFTVEQIFSNRDSMQTIEVNASPLLDSENLMRGLVMVFHDISEIKQHEMARKDFVANVSHELKTPLSVFKGYLETILEKRDPSVEECVRTLGILKRHSDRLNFLVTDLLSLSRLEAGNFAPEMVMVRPHAFLGKLFGEWEELCNDKNRSLHLVVPNLPSVEADPLLLEQVFYNLLDNAIKYSGEGKDIEMGATLKEGGEFVEFFVKDYGQGIPSEKVGFIFERFYRVDRARSRDTGGTGLGLSIVKEIVETHGGEIDAESRVGKGTRISFTIPVASLPKEGDLDEEACCGSDVECGSESIQPATTSKPKKGKKTSDQPAGLGAKGCATRASHKAKAPAKA